MSGGWIGVDLDGTLASYDDWQGETVIGQPIPAMVDRVQDWLAGGWEVKIVTARAPSGAARAAIGKWCLAVGLPVLPITDRKDFSMVELWDDRAIQVLHNTGQPVAGSASRVESIRLQPTVVDTLERTIGRVGRLEKQLEGALGPHALGTPILNGDTRIVNWCECGQDFLGRQGDPLREQERQVRQQHRDHLEAVTE